MFFYTHWVCFIFAFYRVLIKIFQFWFSHAKWLAKLPIDCNLGDLYVSSFKNSSIGVCKNGHQHHYNNHYCPSVLQEWNLSYEFISMEWMCFLYDRWRTWWTCLMLGSNMVKKNSWLFVNVCPAAELPAYIQMCLYTSST